MTKPVLKTRYYVRGDAKEGEPGTYYCTGCDEFVFADHFDLADHVKGRARRYKSSLAVWSRLRRRTPSRFWRPGDAENVLADLAAADNRAAKVTPSQFHRWLMRQRDRDDPIGDLAQDAERDSAFPSHSTSHSKIREHMERHRACDESLVALDEAFREFKSRDRARVGLSPKLRFKVFRRDHYRCCLCGASAANGRRLEVDHRVPVANGGTNDLGNLWTLCFECNRGKAAEHL